MPETFKNSLEMMMVKIPEGSFRMGGDMTAEQADENENPRHQVRIKSSFYVGQYAVTQSQWEAVMGDNPSEFPGALHPVERVSWNDAREFIKKLNAVEKKGIYRLPSEAEWEYAARAGSQTTYCFGNDSSELESYAWYKKNSDRQTHAVGQLLPNAWGLYDMHGNVHEWCQDWYEKTYYSKSPSVDPPGPPKGLAKISRGGDWGSDDWYCRCAIRSLSSPDRRGNRLGFRLVWVDR
jgi:formylglycine-generating enzyme required for sulfatase activity